MTKAVKFKKILSKAVPMWLVIIIVLNTAMVTVLVENLYLRSQLNKNLADLAKTTNDPQQLIQILKQQVLPQEGYTTSLKWKDLGKRLVEAGAIDKAKFEESLGGDPGGSTYMKYLDGSSDDNIAINEQNSHFVVNFFWALGLANKSKVLDEGPMKIGRTPTENFASTAGWTLGAKDAMKIYSSSGIIPLSTQQQDLVKKIAENVFRPCCGNPTSFPDCNHGMAALGYIEWAVYNGLSEKQIYKDLLAFNSFWFPQNYLEMAVYFDKQGTKWKDVDPKKALSAEFSSAQGAAKVRQAVQAVPGVQSQGGGCGT